MPKATKSLTSNQNVIIVLKWTYMLQNHYNQIKQSKNKKNKSNVQNSLKSTTKITQWLKSIKIQMNIWTPIKLSKIFTTKQMLQNL